MANKLLTFILILVCQITFSQTISVSPEQYTFLSYIEYEYILEHKAEQSLDGNYYVVDKKNNISIKRYKKGIKTGEWLSFYKFFDGLRLNYIAHYKNGKLHGYFFITDNHDYSEQGYYRQGKKHGLWTKKTYSDSDIIETTRYKAGKKHGEYNIKKIVENTEKIIKKEYYKNDKLVKRVL